MRRTDLPPDLTFEQFKALATREPDLRGEWIYELEVDQFDDKDTSMYPEFKLGSSARYLFGTLEDAEQYMCQNLIRPSVYRFVVIQRPIGRGMDEHGAIWLYDHTGTMIDRSITHGDKGGGIESIFFGRPKEQMRFRKGDIVEVTGHDNVHLAIVAAEPYPFEWYWERYRCSSGDYYFDVSDEVAYSLLDGPGFSYHDHASALSLMPPRRPVPDDIRRYFEYCLECAEEEDCGDIYHAGYFFDGNVGELGGTRIDIIYDSVTKRHRLVYICDNAIKVTNDRQIELPGDLDGFELDRLTRWLDEVMYGRTRLWYLIRYWNIKCRDYQLQPELPLDTTIAQLLR